MNRDPRPFVGDVVLCEACGVLSELGEADVFATDAASEDDFGGFPVRCSACWGYDVRRINPEAKP